MHCFMRYTACSANIRLSSPALSSLPSLPSFPQTDPAIVFPNYEYCTEIHEDADVIDHKSVCDERGLSIWVALVDSAVNTACRQERETPHQYVVSGHWRP